MESKIRANRAAADKPALDIDAVINSLLGESIDGLLKKFKEWSGGKEPCDVQPARITAFIKEVGLSKEDANELWDLHYAEYSMAEAKKGIPRPPKPWAKKAIADIKKKNPSWSMDRVRKTMGETWYNKMSDKSRAAAKRGPLGTKNEAIDEFEEPLRTVEHRGRTIEVTRTGWYSTFSDAQGMYIKADTLGGLKRMIDEEDGVEPGDYDDGDYDESVDAVIKDVSVMDVLVDTSVLENMGIHPQITKRIAGKFFTIDEVQKFKAVADQGAVEKALGVLGIDVADLSADIVDKAGESLDKLLGWIGSKVKGAGESPNVKKAREDQAKRKAAEQPKKA
jgi:hypothetical protein